MQKLSFERAGSQAFADHWSTQKKFLSQQQLSLLDSDRWMLRFSRYYHWQESFWSIN